MQEEIWKDVVGYEQYFRVSNYGNVFSRRTNRILKQHIRPDRRVTVSTRIGGKNGKTVCFKVHRLVAEAFIPNPENKPQVNHIDGNPSNNILTNLEWVTASENIQHAYANSLMSAGDRSGTKNTNSKLTEENVKYIRENPDNLTVRELGEIFSVHHSKIVRCKNFKSYKD